MQHCVGHTTWAPKEHEGWSQAGPKGRQLEVGAQQAPGVLVIIYSFKAFARTHLVCHFAIGINFLHNFIQISFPTNFWNT